ncbi:hypothetical protein L6259_02370 [Candidatus Parcubacteria bacterium]|nr:hypothetical protein [Patescibacteria group bacterium]MCG2694094.1 hypothetical protein [Candidatus Parcubacteria bacterium]
MPKKERTGIIVLACAGVLALIFGAWNLGHDIKKPFLLKPGQAITTATSDNLFFELQGKDTDKDGLSDYDELYIYETSPYLEDSDSDGKLDSEEVSGGSDPNCPEGKECGVQVKTASEPVGFDVPTAADISQNSADQSDTAGIDINNLTVDAIKQILEASGIGKDVLDQIDDATLMDIYYKTLEETQN